MLAKKSKPETKIDEYISEKRDQMVKVIYDTLDPNQVGLLLPKSKDGAKDKVSAKKFICLREDLPPHTYINATIEMTVLLMIGELAKKIKDKLDKGKVKRKVYIWDLTGKTTNHEKKTFEGKSLVEHKIQVDTYIWEDE